MAQLYKRTYDKSNFIHPTAIIGDDVEMGRNNYIGPYCVIYSNCDIGDNNRFESHCVINSLPEHKDNFIVGTSFGTRIGNNNTIREFTTINAGTKQNTIIGDNNIMLRGSHVGHDVVLENNITLSCNSILGGHSYLMEGCNMALGSVCHQFSVIGAYSMVGMNSTVIKKSLISPGGIYVGSPVEYIGQNKIGLSRNDISNTKLLELMKRWTELSKRIQFRIE